MLMPKFLFVFSMVAICSLLITAAPPASNNTTPTPATTTPQTPSSTNPSSKNKPALVHSTTTQKSAGAQTPCEWCCNSCKQCPALGPAPQKHKQETKIVKPNADGDEQWPPMLPNGLPKNAPITLLVMAYEMTDKNDEEKEPRFEHDEIRISQVLFVKEDRAAINHAFHNFKSRLGSEKAAVEAIRKNNTRAYLKILGVLYQTLDAYRALTSEARAFFDDATVLYQMYITQKFNDDKKTKNTSALDKATMELMKKFKLLTPAARYNLVGEFPVMVHEIEREEAAARAAENPNKFGTSNWETTTPAVVLDFS